MSVVYKPSALSRVARTAHEEDQAAALAVMANLSRTLEANLAPYEPVALGVYEQGRRHYSRLLEFLARLVNACDERVPLNVAPAAQLLGTGRLLFGWETVEYRAPTWTRLAAFLGFKEYPNPTRAGMLDGLLAAPFPLVLTQSFTFLGRGTALGLMDRQAQRLGNSGDAAVSQVLALRTAIDALASGEFVMGDHHWSLQVLTPPFERDGSERVRVAALHESIAQARSMLADVGCLTAREDFAVAPAFWAQLPGNHAERPRLAPITSRNFAALAPLHAYTGGRASGRNCARAPVRSTTSRCTPPTRAIPPVDRAAIPATPSSAVRPDRARRCSLPFWCACSNVPAPPRSSSTRTADSRCWFGRWTGSTCRCAAACRRAATHCRSVRARGNAPSCAAGC
jgi:type IV secretion system protein VirB4